MYTLTNIITFYDKDFTTKNNINDILISNEISFKEYPSIKMLLPALKNPNNYIIIAINNKNTLNEVENVALDCFNYQKRIFVLFESGDIVDHFFQNSYIITQPNHIKQFTQSIKKIKTPQHQTSTLLKKLVSLELEKLGIPKKYIGFTYLADIVENSLKNNFYANTYIDFFANTARKSLEPVDTIERNIRHMLCTTWKNNINFRQTLRTSCELTKPNSINILYAVINYLKSVI